MNRTRNIFIVVAGGNPDAERHFQDTIRKKRSIKEVRRFLSTDQIKSLEDIYHGSDFIVWGAVPGPINEINWQSMQVGDVVLIYNQGTICFVGEIATTARNKELARYFWRETDKGKTWELMYFIVNEERINLPIEKLNPLFGYKPNYRPRGFSKINEEAVLNFLNSYGDILGALKTLEKGEELIHIPNKKEIFSVLDEKVERASTEHDELQWRLIRLGKLAKYDVWVTKSDQSKVYNGHLFRNFVISEFHNIQDVPPSITNIDVVWKFGPYSIKSAFEIENTTSIYSGILRLSDLRAENANSNYPLFIVASEQRKRKVFDELKRPTFYGAPLRLNEVIRYLDYQKVREIDEEYKDTGSFNTDIILAAGDKIE